MESGIVFGVVEVVREETLWSSRRAIDAGGGHVGHREYRGRWFLQGQDVIHGLGAALLDEAGLVRATKAGRETRFEASTASMQPAADWVEATDQAWSHRPAPPKPRVRPTRRGPPRSGFCVPAA